MEKEGVRVNSQMNSSRLTGKFDNIIDFSRLKLTSSETSINGSMKAESNYTLLPKFFYNSGNLDPVIDEPRV